MEAVDGIKEFEGLISEAIAKRSEAFIWDISGDEVIRIPVKLEALNGFASRVVFTLDHRAKYYINDLIKGVGMLKFYIPAQQLLFISKIDIYQGTNLEIYYPEAFKKHDRRKDDRLEPLIPVHFLGNGFKKECYDISTGGFSFIMNNSEFKSVKYGKGQVIECEIQFPFKTVKVKAKIVNLIEIKPYQLERFPYGAKKVALMIEENDFYLESFNKFQKNMRKMLVDLL